MIVDHVQNGHLYERIHPRIAEVFDYYRAHDLAQLELGKHAIDGDQLFVIIGREPGRGQAGAKLEAHGRYLDVQIPLACDDAFGWRPVNTCRVPEGEFDAARDIIFFRDRPQFWCDLPAGTFAIFLPHDAHAPLAVETPVHKAVFKIARS